jgi:A/G-specific adenine glycosylase
LDGRFPDSYEGIRALKGIGDYTAAAIASFAYELPYAVLDGNVYRIIARYFGIETPVDLPTGKKVYTELAQQLLDSNRPAAWNQAMMDFGATWCTPRRPRCVNCPMQVHCVAFQQNRVLELPKKAKKMQRKTRIFLYLVARIGDDVFIRKRTEKDIWKNLYEFPMVEINTLPESSIEAVSIIQNNLFEAISREERGPLSAPLKQVLTHQEIISLFQEVQVKKENKENFLKNCPSDWILAKQKEIKNTFAFPKTVDTFLRGGNQTFTLFF